MQEAIKWYEETDALNASRPLCHDHCGRGVVRRPRHHGRQCDGMGIRTLRCIFKQRHGESLQDGRRKGSPQAPRRITSSTSQRLPCAGAAGERDLLGIPGSSRRPKDRVAGAFGPHVSVTCRRIPAVANAACYSFHSLRTLCGDERASPFPPRSCDTMARGAPPPSSKPADDDRSGAAGEPKQSKRRCVQSACVPCRKRKSKVGHPGRGVVRCDC